MAGLLYHGIETFLCGALGAVGGALRTFDSYTALVYRSIIIRADGLHLVGAGILIISTFKDVEELELVFRHIEAALIIFAVIHHLLHTVFVACGVQHGMSAWTPFALFSLLA